MTTPRKNCKSHNPQEIEWIAKLHAAKLITTGFLPDHPAAGKPYCRKGGREQRGCDQQKELGLQRGHDADDAEEHDRRRNRDASGQQSGRSFVSGRAPRIGDGDRG
jgi:hypothetical protein